MSFQNVTAFITAFFNKVLEIMKTKKKAESLAKERSLPKKKQST